MMGKQRDLFAMEMCAVKLDKAPKYIMCVAYINRGVLVLCNSIRVFK